MSIQDKASELLRLHDAPELLSLVNVWDVVSARVIAELPDTKALATASHSIAASWGYPDGEHIPLTTMIESVGRIAAATELPVTADLEGGYGNAGETIRRAIGVGIVGANIEDQMRPLTDAVASVAAAVAAAQAEGVPSFVLNARTDAFITAGDRPRDEVVADAIERGLAFLEAGASCFFVPGIRGEAEIARVAEAVGERRLSVIGGPTSLPPARLAELGVARVSYGPWSQRVALTALADAASALYNGGTLPETTRVLN